MDRFTSVRDDRRGVSVGGAGRAMRANVRRMLDTIAQKNRLRAPVIASDSAAIHYNAIANT